MVLMRSWGFATLLLLGCSLPAPDPLDDAPADPVGSAGMPDDGAGGAPEVVEGLPKSGAGGVAGGVGAGMGGVEVGGAPAISGGGNVAAAGKAGSSSEPPCCSGMFNGIGQCIVTPACAAGGMGGVAGSTAEPPECKCGHWSCCSAHDSFGECTATTTVTGCKDGPDSLAGCSLIVPLC
jgi:hypothetical protein